MADPWTVRVDARTKPASKLLDGAEGTSISGALRACNSKRTREVTR